MLAKRFLIVLLFVMIILVIAFAVTCGAMCGEIIYDGIDAIPSEALK